MEKKNFSYFFWDGTPNQKQKEGVETEGEGRSTRLAPNIIIYYLVPPAPLRSLFSRVPPVPLPDRRRRRARPLPFNPRPPGEAGQPGGRRLKPASQVDRVDRPPSKRTELLIVGRRTAGRRTAGQVVPQARQPDRRRRRTHQATQ